MAREFAFAYYFTKRVRSQLLRPVRKEGPLDREVVDMATKTLERMRHAMIELGYDPDRDPKEAIYAI